MLSLDPYACEESICPPDQAGFIWIDSRPERPVNESVETEASSLQPFDLLGASLDQKVSRRLQEFGTRIHFES